MVGDLGHHWVREVSQLHPPIKPKFSNLISLTNQNCARDMNMVKLHGQVIGKQSQSTSTKQKNTKQKVRHDLEAKKITLRC